MNTQIVKRKNKRNYVNNPDFLEAIIKHKALCDQARAEDKPLPVVSNYIGDCIMKIAKNLATKGNFSGYTFKEDMIMDGIENCLLYIEKFNPEKYDNPFAYFTRVIWYAYLRRIAKEKKHLYTKLKSSQDMLVFGGTHEGSGEIMSNLTMDMDYINNFIQDYEDKILRDKEKSEKVKELKRGGDQDVTSDH